MTAPRRRLLSSAIPRSAAPFDAVIVVINLLPFFAAPNIGGAMRQGLIVFISALGFALPACGGASAPAATPPNRCTATMSSLQALEPACWVERDGGPSPNDAASSQPSQD
jgi:hypothetical protein